MMVLSQQYEETDSEVSEDRKFLSRRVMRAVNRMLIKKLWSAQ